MRLEYEACVPALQILIAQLPRRLVKFALKFWLKFEVYKNLAELWLVLVGSAL